MALIKCPECGHDVSTKADFCPNCGYVLNREKENITKQAEGTKPNKSKSMDMSLINRLKARKKSIVLIWLSLFAVTLIIGIILMANYFDFDDLTLFFVGLGMCCFSLISLVFALIVLVEAKVIYRIIDGNLIVVYTCIKNILYVNNKEVSACYFNRYLYGDLPDGKQIWVRMSAWDNSVKIGIGPNDNEGQII